MRPYFDEPCADSEATGMLLWGDLHAHSTWSFDAGAYGAQVTGEEAFAYAKGETVLLPDENGELTRTATIDRPLDFVGMTDHGEFLGEIKICTEPTWAGYASETCENWRDVEARNGAYDFGILMADPSPDRFDDVCGSGTDCEDAARIRWAGIQRIARLMMASACGIHLVYRVRIHQHSGCINLHRTVITGSDIVPVCPSSH